MHLNSCFAASPRSLCKVQTEHSMWFALTAALVVVVVLWAPGSEYVGGGVGSAVIMADDGDDLNDDDDDDGTSSPIITPVGGTPEVNGILDTGTDAAASSLVPVSDASEAGGSDAGSDAGGSDAGGGTLAEDKDDFAGPPEFCIRFKIRAFSSSFERGSEDAF